MAKIDAVIIRRSRDENTVALVSAECDPEIIEGANELFGAISQAVTLWAQHDEGQRKDVFGRDKIWGNDAGDMIEHMDGVLLEQGLAPESAVPMIVDEGAMYWVDLPTVECIHNEEGGWRNVGEFSTKAAALAF